MVNNNFFKKRINPITFVVLSFLFIIIAGAVILMLPVSSREGKVTPFIDALFTSTSATCVTGLVVKDTSTYFSLFGQLIILLLIQIGGLGYMTITTFFALLIGQKIHLTQRLILKEHINKPTLAEIIGFTRHIFYSVIIIEGLGALILFLHWKYLGFWTAVKYGIFHSISAFNNAGFDVIGNFKSFTGYVADPVVNITISFLIIFGGIGFLVISNLYQYFVYKKRISLQSKIVLTATIILVLGGTILLFIFEQNNPATLAPLSLQGKIFASSFQSISARTAGFNTIDIGKMTMAGLFTLIILMFIGASPGGTGGGIKTVTFIVVLAAIFSSIKEKENTEILNRSICIELVMKAMSIFIVSLFLVTAILLVLCAVNEFSFMQNLFEVVSGFGTVGLSTGITPYLNTVSKALISFTIFVGRVGVLSFILAFSTKKASCKVKFPEEYLSIG